MEPIRGIILGLSLLIGIVLLSPSFASEDESLLEEFRENLSKKMSTEIADQLRSEFEDAGLPPSDIEGIVANLADAINMCFFESVVEFTQQYDIPLADLIGDGNGGIEFAGDNLDLADGFQELLSPCIYAARAEAGVAK